MCLLSGCFLFVCGVFLAMPQAHLKYLSEVIGLPPIFHLSTVIILLWSQHFWKCVWEGPLTVARCLSRSEKSINKILDRKMEASLYNALQSLHGCWEGLSRNCKMRWGTMTAPPLGMGQWALRFQSSEVLGRKASAFFFTWGSFPQLPTLLEVENPSVTEASMGQAEPPRPHSPRAPHKREPHTWWTASHSNLGTSSILKSDPIRSILTLLEEWREERKERKRITLNELHLLAVWPWSG